MGNLLVKNSAVGSLRFWRKRKDNNKNVVSEDSSLEEEVPWEPFVPLTDEERAEILLAFSADRDKVLVTHDKTGIEITAGKFQCLIEGAWLNDELTIGENGYDFKSVKRWTSLKKLGYGLHECDKIFVPIHKDAHWRLAVINNKDKKFQYLDSMKVNDTHVLEVLARYYADEVKDKTGEDMDVSSWEKEFVEDLPEQKNRSDCGVFMIKYADFYGRNLGLCFNQEHMPYFRLRTAKEILRLKAD